ncbi:Short-chain dehydrogenase/reductase SDR [Pyrenophora tritici-repentis]|uniref:Short-chain dehydrogenase/reductase SDR n=3 Tax=Pyrenophora tritici-repentis TaxID=45151 RepID=A0A2W1GQF0_9PLEO|nr:uncharacterized protein PTRG_04931 [Pyrenophora tritici-repentis Pt-1C-BFP]KAA8611939.1 Short-chain dehydrogenase/reductase SDR [Pyrenophora tritici-repentis]EDU47838.1 conserved hypothetical protein [Pyrenophora tritici-repentis Pt-1C-BFP]KAG9382744.1 Short-chain dehydrogenase/reductase SDR [Pyrenophora tritici-repentis]KAI0570930.1 Short-chain dehydrogenase/reductase SDR [Pyrenophora tritici-repentis]KAI0586795.1 Short-chain dehydrogenase/reductase SDR [Pyrenophora tritici-repentis]
MTTINITDGELDDIKDQVAIITGLATLRRVIKHGGKVFAGDLNPLPEPEASSVPWLKVDVTSWDSQLALFKAALQKYGKIDHVFANAGINTVASLLEDDVDGNGNLLPPKLSTVNVNLVGVMYTVKLGLYYLKKNPGDGSIVMTSSAAGFYRLPSPDYNATKHAVIGLMRGLEPLLHPRVPIRINVVAPSWTDTALVPPVVKTIMGDIFQSPDVMARATVLLMVDKERHGNMVFGQGGKCVELENGENGYVAFTDKTAQMVGVKEVQAAALAQFV